MGKRKVKKQHLYIILSALLAVVLAIGAIFVFGGDESKNISISIGDVSAIAGDTIKLPFNISDNSSVWGGQIKINYNEKVFDFISCANGDVFDECEVNDNNGTVNLLVNQTELENTKENGLVATLNFKVKTTAIDGEYEISFDKETNFSNIDGELKEVSFDNGTVTVK